MTRNTGQLTRRLITLWPTYTEAGTLRLDSESMWRRLREESRTAAGEAHVVIASHTALPDDDRSMWSMEDLARASRYAPGERQRAFIAGRQLLHRLVAGGGALQLCFNAHGKPRQPGGCHFSVSHAACHSALALCQAGPLGVDIEVGQRLDEPGRLVDLVAHPNEAVIFRQAPTADLTPLFLRCWTRKEALLKAWGCGLTLPLQEIDTHLHEATPWIDVEGGWRLVGAALPQWHMAVAVPGGVTRVTLSVVQPLA